MNSMNELINNKNAIAVRVSANMQTHALQGVVSACNFFVK
jgi:hypothetical protein